MTFDPSKACCFTGHRRISDEKVPLLVGRIKTELGYLLGNGVTTFITGGALGFDTLAALTLLTLKAQGAEISLHLMLPCPEQTKNWRGCDVRVYEYILDHSDSYKYINDHYHCGVMQMRNRAMVDASEYCVCYWDKEYGDGKSGGTLYTVNYAKKKGHRVINLWDTPPEDMQFTFGFTE